MAIIERDYKDFLKNNMMDYYNEVLCHRAIPETRDGLMEVQRRILWTCYEHNFLSSKNYVKCAKINGNTLEYHYHGQASVYEALVNMSQDWKNHICTIDTFGSNGSIYGDSQAADRYLEARLDKNAELIYLDEIKSDCIDMVPNYDLTSKEPLILPSKLPMYLINGAFGISGGYAVSVPAHNPIEVIDAHINRIKDPNYDINIFPDFPTGGYVVNNEELRKGYKEGRGRCIIRGKFFKDVKNHSLILTEIPYMKTLDFIKEEIKNLTKETKDGKKIIPPKIQSIKNIRDGSEGNKIKLIIEVKKDIPLNYVENQLYSLTSCQTTFPIILLGTKDRKFKIYKDINEVADEWIDFRHTTIKRIKLGLIKKYKYRMHIIDGLLKILSPSIIDKVITMIKTCKGKKEVIEKLIDNYNLSEVQAENVSMTPLYRLSSLSIQELNDEYKELENKVKEETKFFKDKSKISDLIIEELEGFKKKFAKITRKTVVLDKIEDLKNAVVPDTNHTIVVTKEGYIKKLSPVQSQKRNGKGINVGKMKDNDYPVFIEELSNKDYLFIFTDVGKVYKQEIRELNEGTTSTLGNYISPSINNESITACIKIPHILNTEDYGILIATKRNKIKISEFKEFDNIGRSGLIASKLNEGDSILSAILIKIKENRIPKEIIVSHSGGNSALMESEEIPLIGRTTFGSMAMSNDIIKEGHEIVSVSARKDTDTFLLVISKLGYGKLVDIEEFTKVKRGVKGMMNAKLVDGDKTLAVLFCNLDQELTLVSNKSIIKINVKDIVKMKRPTKGVALKNLTEDEELIDASLI